MAEPMPVPSVVTMTRPSLPLAAPKCTSATPAASASLTRTMSRPRVSSKIRSARALTQDLSMFAADSVTPCWTMAGIVTPMGESPIWSAKCSAIWPTMAATF